MIACAVAAALDTGAPITSALGANPSICDKAIVAQVQAAVPATTHRQAKLMASNRVAGDGLLQMLLQPP